MFQGLKTTVRSRPANKQAGNGRSPLFLMQWHFMLVANSTVARDKEKRQQMTLCHGLLQNTVFHLASICHHVCVGIALQI